MYTEEAGRNARQPSYRLTFTDAVDVWKLHWQGWYQNRIAARFDVNQGRVNEVLKGHRHPGSKQAAQDGLN
jgi:predicted XRE-type DNA-binding protein